MISDTFFDEGTEDTLRDGKIYASTADLGFGVCGMAYICRRGHWHIVGADWLSKKEEEDLYQELTGMFAILWGVA